MKRMISEHDYDDIKFQITNIISERGLLGFTEIFADVADTDIKLCVKVKNSETDNKDSIRTELLRGYIKYFGEINKVNNKIEIGGII